MFSMSAGLRSVIRLTWASCSVDGFDPVEAAVTASMLDVIAASLTMTPSTT